MQLFVDGTERADLRLEEGWWTYAFPLPKFSIGSHDVRLHLAPDVPLPLSTAPLLTFRTLQVVYPVQEREETAVAPVQQIEPHG